MSEPPDGGPDRRGDASHRRPCTIGHLRPALLDARVPHARDLTGV